MEHPPDGAIATVAGTEYVLRQNRWGGLDFWTDLGLVRCLQEAPDRRGRPGNYHLRRANRNETTLWEVLFGPDVPERVRIEARLRALEEIGLGALEVPEGRW